ncbi:hypothetical protein V6N13_148179 [Hibiscus sabdariffa]|uniref:Uncharacterized protein n=1 Tax=Hibiscus sabdariffa TaxID=183260 RepID=A0ABR2TXT5_9ROSI
MRLEKMEKIGLKDQDLVKCRREYQLKEEQFQRKLKALKEHCSDLEMIEKEVQKEIKREDGEFLQRCRELKLMEDSVTMQFEELKEKEEHFRSKMNQFWRFFTTHERNLEMGNQDGQEKHNHDEDQIEQLGLKDWNFEQCSKDIEFKEKHNHDEDLEQRYQELEVKENKLYAYLI